MPNRPYAGASVPVGNPLEPAPPATAELRVQHSTCECAVAQIKPMWDRHGCLVCEDCYGRIARADKMSGQNARPGEVD